MKKYRIVQRGNGKFYAQERCFLFFWRDASWSSGSANQYHSMRDIENRQEQDDRIRNFKTIKKVIEV